MSVDVSRAGRPHESWAGPSTSNARGLTVDRVRRRGVLVVERTRRRSETTPPRAISWHPASRSQESRRRSGRPHQVPHCARPLGGAHQRRQEFQQCIQDMSRRARPPL